VANTLRYTLLTDGSSDATLKFPINWLLEQYQVRSFVDQWADLAFHARRPRKLAERLRIVCDEYPCDVLFVHRDSERASLPARVKEIRKDLALAGVRTQAVCVIAVRMTEAWLLHDPEAIRLAAGNPAGRVPLKLPALANIESEANPKRLLRQALLDASEAQGRRRKQRDRDFGPKRFRVAELIADWDPLRRLAAFRFLEDELKRALGALAAQLPPGSSI